MAEPLLQPRIAAIALDADAHVEGFMLPLVARLRAAGWVVGGAVAPFEEFHDDCCRAMFLEDLLSGERVQISQDLGSGASGCVVDPAQLADAGRFVRHALDRPADLVVVNKFGKFEASGQGLRSDMILALDAGLPLLTTVKPSIVPAWNDFVGDYGCLLRPDRAAVIAWCDSVRILPA